MNHSFLTKQKAIELFKSYCNDDRVFNFSLYGHDGQIDYSIIKNAEHENLFLNENITKYFYLTMYNNNKAGELSVFGNIFILNKKEIDYLKGLFLESFSYKIINFFFLPIFGKNRRCVIIEKMNSDNNVVFEREYHDLAEYNGIKSNNTFINNNVFDTLYNIVNHEKFVTFEYYEEHNNTFYIIVNSDLTISLDFRENLYYYLNFNDNVSVLINYKSIEKVINVLKKKLDNREESEIKKELKLYNIN